MGEQFQYLSLVFRYWGHRLNFISNVSACGDATVNAEEPVNLPEKFLLGCPVWAEAVTTARISKSTPAHPTSDPRRVIVYCRSSGSS